MTGDSDQGLRRRVVELERAQTRQRRRTAWLCGALLLGLSAKLGAQSVPNVFVAGTPATAADVNANFQWVGERVVPVGTIMAFGGTTPPAGWLACDGSALDVGAYPDLAAVLGTTWGSPTRLPDLRGRFPRGTDGAHPIGQYQEDALQNITGSLPRTHADSASAYAATGAFRWSHVAGFSANSGAADSIATITFDASRVARTATETRPRNAAVLFIIKH